VNVGRGSLLGFYIFKGEWIIDDYIRHCNLKTCMAMQTKAWMMVFLFKKFFLFFTSSIPKAFVHQVDIY
jgi:hypothetical protein